MKSFALMAAALFLGFTLVTGDAEAARRFGGGSSSGMQRQSISPQKSVTPAPAPAPHQATNQAAPASQPGMAPQAQPRRSWMGPLAGLAAGLGLAALASHFGFGEELASMLMMGLLAMVVIGVIGYFIRKKAAAHAGPALAGAGMNRYAGTDFNRDREPVSGYAPAAAPVSGGVASGPSGNIPADFDVAGFVRNAKVNFIRLQAANDARNLDDIREFTTPEMFGEIKMHMMDRGTAAQETDVVQVDADVLDVSEEAGRYVVSVRFHGLIREEKAAQPEPFDEIWHMVKPRDGSSGWVLAGIQQVQ